MDISPGPDGHSDFELMLLEQVADRWSGEDAPACTCVWFEIDRARSTTGRGRPRYCLACSESQAYSSGAVVVLRIVYRQGSLPGVVKSGSA